MLWYNLGMDDDMDEFDDELDEIDDDNFVDGDEEISERPSDMGGAKSAGFDDGCMDASNNACIYQGYGLSVNEDEMTDEEREAYEEGYMDGYQMGDQNP